MRGPWSIAISELGSFPTGIEPVVGLLFLSSCAIVVFAEMSCIDLSRGSLEEAPPESKTTPSFLLLFGLYLDLPGGLPCMLGVVLVEVDPG